VAPDPISKRAELTVFAFALVATGIGASRRTPGVEAIFICMNSGRLAMVGTVPITARKKSWKSESVRESKNFPQVSTEINEITATRSWFLCPAHNPSAEGSHLQ
jgi:hypothetical protein